MKCLKCPKPLKKKALHGFCPPCFKKEFFLGNTADFEDLKERNSPSGFSSSKAFGKFNTSFFHGTYKKYTASLEKKNYILKVRQDEHPELPCIEFVSNKIARILGLPVAEFHFIKFNNHIDTFLSRNILDNKAHSVLHHIYKYLEDNDSFNCETLIRIIQERTKKLSDVHQFINLCLFDALIGNHDRHGRNLAFIERPKGDVTLAPFYDNPSYVGIAEWDFLEADLNPAGIIQTPNNKEPSLKDYFKEFERLDFGNILKKFYGKTLSKFSEIVNTVNSEENISKKRRCAFIKLIEKRMNELEKC